MVLQNTLERINAEVPESGVTPFQHSCRDIRCGKKLWSYEERDTLLAEEIHDPVHFVGIARAREGKFDSASWEMKHARFIRPLGA